MTVVGAARALYAILNALGLVDYAKHLALATTPVKRTRAAAAVLAVLPGCWARIDRAGLKTDFDFMFALSTEVGKVLERHPEAITEESTIIIPGWVRTQRAFELAAGDAWKQADWSKP